MSSNSTTACRCASTSPLRIDDFEAVDRAAKAREVLESETFYDCMRELPDGAVQTYLRDPAGI